MAELKISPMPYQQEALCDYDTRFLGVSGGKRSGKTRMITCLKSIILSSLHPGKIGVVASPVYGMTRRNLLPQYRALALELGLDIKGLEVAAPNKLEITWGDKTSTIILDVTIENYGRLNGPSLAWVCVDEADKARYEDMKAFIEEATFRISDPYPGRSAQINITGAPELNGFMGEFFIENSAPDKKLYTWSMMDNELLSDEYKQSILATIPLNKQEGWVHGRPMYNSDGLVYDSYDPTKNHIDFTIHDVKPLEKIQVCWDINDGGTSVVIGVRRGPFLIIFDEWMGMKDTEAVISKVKQQPWASRAVLSCDPASTQVFTYIHKSGLEHQIMRSAPEVAHRVTAVNLRFGTSSMFEAGIERPHLLINTKRCKILNRCLTRQGYINGAPDKKTKIEEAKTDISGPIDSLGYLVYREFPYAAKGRPTIRTVTPS